MISLILYYKLVDTGKGPECNVSEADLPLIKNMSPIKKHDRKSEGEEEPSIGTCSIEEVVKKANDMAKKISKKLYSMNNGKMYK